MFAPGFDSERLTRLCGTGVPFRPLFCPIPPCNVPGPKNSFQLRPLPTRGRPRRERNYPDKQRSIRKKTCSVKLSSKRTMWKSGQNWHFGPALPAKLGMLSSLNSCRPRQTHTFYRSTHNYCSNNHLRVPAISQQVMGYHGALTRRWSITA